MDRISATDLNNMLQKLYPIIKCGHIQPEEYDLVERAISLFSSTTPTCLADSLIVKYNLCILLEASGRSNRQAFEAALSDFNSILLPLVKQNYPLSESLVEKAAEINCRSHKYDIAFDYLFPLLKHSKAADFGQDDNEEKKTRVSREFRNHWLAALCQENIGLSFWHKHEGPVESRTYLCNAARVLIGSTLYGINTDVTDERSTAEKYDRGKVIGDILALKKLSNAEILERLCDKDESKLFKDQNWKSICLAQIVFQWKKNNLIDANDYNRFIADISHTLSHCLSEIVKFRPTSKEKSLIDSYYIRISDRLLENLGVEYSTCRATIINERREYHVALNYLVNTKEQVAILNADNQDKKRTADQLALIDFYIWYFSVLGHEESLAGQSRDSFYHYCEATGDPVAMTYYGVISMKERLLDGFRSLSSGVGAEAIDAKITSLSEDYKFFVAHEPHQNIHPAIYDEWRLLNTAYEALKIVYSFIQQYNDRTCFCQSMLELFLADRASMSFDQQNSDSTSSINHEDRELFYQIKSESHGSFIFRGNIRTIKEIQSKWNEGFSNKEKLTKNLNMLLSTQPISDISNILIIFREETIEADICFLRDIAEFDQNKKPEEQHSFYLDLTNIGDDRFNEAVTRYDADNSISNASHRIKKFYLHTDAFNLCCSFAFLEHLLSKLQQPYDSYLVSPITSDITYLEQAGRSASGNPESDLLMYQEVESIKSAPINNLSPIIRSCFSSKQFSIGRKWEINFDYLDTHSSFREYLSQVVQITFTAKESSSSKRYGSSTIVFFDEFESKSSATSDPIYTAEGLEFQASIAPYYLELKDKTPKYHSCDSCISLVLNRTEMNKFETMKEYLLAYTGKTVADGPMVIQRYSDIEDTRITFLIFVLGNAPDSFTLTERDCESIKDYMKYIKAKP